MPRELTPEERQDRMAALYELAVRVASNCEHVGAEACEGCNYIEVCKDVRKDDWAFMENQKKEREEAEND